MTEVSFLRHAGWFGPEDTCQLNIIGVGATGSYIGLIAAKMGFHKFQVWDGDIVETHNLPNQIYDVCHVGEPKVNAFEEVLRRFNPRIEVMKHNKFFTSAEHKTSLEGPLILTVDTMSARKDIYDAFKLNWRVKKVYETRLGFDYGELNIINNLNTNELDGWMSTLRNDNEIPDGPCNLRLCTTLVTLTASYTVHCLCNDLSKDPKPLKKKTMISLTPILETYNI